MPGYHVPHVVPRNPCHNRCYLRSRRICQRCHRSRFTNGRTGTSYRYGVTERSNGIDVDPFICHQCMAGAGGGFLSHHRAATLAPVRVRMHRHLVWNRVARTNGHRMVICPAGHSVVRLFRSESADPADSIARTLGTMALSGSRQWRSFRRFPGLCSVSGYAIG